MTWSELIAAAGGRGQRGGNNHHPVPVFQCSKLAQDRLEYLHIDDIDELFSLRLSNVVRVYGIRDGRTLKLLWFDPAHDNRAIAVYPPAAR